MTPSPPPGWYPDQSSGLQRYWDGNQWAPTTAPIAQFAPPKKSGGGVKVIVLLGVLLFLASSSSSSSSTRAIPRYEPTQTTTTKPAMSDSEVDDLAFIGTLDMFNVPYDSEAEAVTEAKSLCLWLQSNDTFLEAGAMELMKEHPEFTAEDAGHFAGAATSAYCPRFSPDGH
jgi:hypothetical protein